MPEHRANGNQRSWNGETSETARRLTRNQRQVMSDWIAGHRQYLWALVRNIREPSGRLAGISEWK